MGLQIKNVQKAYGKVIALKSISFEVERGEIRGLLGGNGSGKSTLTKIIGGLASKDEGEILLDGQDIYCKSSQAAKKKNIIVTSQELSLLHNISVSENLCLYIMPQKGLMADRKEAYKIAKKILSDFGLEDLVDKNIAQLAPNERYMIELAKALLQKPQILIVDEITSALFKKDVEKVRDILKALKKEGCIILFITHRMPELYDICDSVTVMRNGETIKSLKMSEANEHELLSLMTGRDMTAASRKVSNEKEEKEVRKDPVLKIRDLNLKGFDGSVAFDLNRGEVVGVAGLQGHGQSTMVRQIFGLYGPVKYWYQGNDVSFNNATQAVKNGIAFVSGDREGEGAFGERSLAENARAVSYVTLKQKKKNVESLFREFNVKFHNSRQTILELSGGNQQKVILSRWTSVHPKVFLADDPTKGVDVQARREVHQILYKLAEEGSAILMVSSDDKELVDLTKGVKNSKVIVMYEGNISAILTGDEITEDNISLASMNMYKGVTK